MFSSPNISSIMGTVPPERRSTATGMLLTMQNTGGTVGLTVLFTEVIGALTGRLPAALSKAMASVGVPQVAPYLSGIPPTLALFAAFLGYNPMVTMISELPKSVSKQIGPQAFAAITSTTWFPRAIAPPFMDAIHVAFYLNAGLAVVAAAASMLRGKRWEYERQTNRREAAIAVSTHTTTASGSTKPRKSKRPHGARRTAASQATNHRLRSVGGRKAV